MSRTYRTTETDVDTLYPHCPHTITFHMFLPLSLPPAGVLESVRHTYTLAQWKQSEIVA